MGRLIRYLTTLTALLIITTAVAGAQFQAVPRLNLQVNPSPALKITNSALSSLVTMGEVDGRVFGAARNQLVALDEQGQITRSITIPVERPAGISAYTAGQALVGDGGNNAIYSVDTASGRSTKLLDLRSTDYGSLMAGDVLRTGELTSVAFDGKLVYAAVAAGYSSSVFAIDPATNRAVRQAWSPGDKPMAMQFSGGTLYVLDAENSQLRAFDSAFKLNLKAVDLNVADPRGIIIRPDGVRVLTPSERSITTVKPSLEVLKVPEVASSSSIVQLKPGVIKAIGSITPLARDYALLICGDVAESGFDEFWNDTVWMYKTLLAAGYSQDNIYALYGWGSDYASPNPNYQHAGQVTDFPATTQWVDKVLSGMKDGDSSLGIDKLTQNDSLFIWVFDHGGGGDEAYFCLTDGAYYDTRFAQRLNALSYREMAIFMQQCRSGGFGDNLQGQKRFVSTACRATENAHRADAEFETVNGVKYHHGEYNYYIISALARRTAAGAPVNADYNGDGRISASEMHTLMAGNENQPEIPQLWDSSGVGARFIP
ncbi:MAG: Peptidase C13 family protein [Firmicutes bacterium ADurb.Bin506]|jgi:hypothetical protein|nr:MAG: Peptidase C13 family protein [Firmicutes bacterium ADurb.Bin506]